MLIRSIVLAGAAATLCSAVAFAANSTPAPSHKPTPDRAIQSAQQLNDRCSSLESQFDQDITTLTTAPKAAAAKSLRSKAESDCQSNRQSTGIKSLVQALKDIGVKANS